MVTRSFISGDVVVSTLDPESQRKQNSSGGSPNPSGRRNRRPVGRWLRAFLAGPLWLRSRRNLFGRPVHGRAGLRRLLASLFPDYKTIRRIPSWRRADRPVFEALEPRIMLSTVTWINLNGGNWNDANNWTNNSTGAHVLPGAGDTAVIANLNAGDQVTYSSGSYTVAGVQDSSPMAITGGTLTVTGTTQVTSGGSLTLQGGTLADTTLQTGTGGNVAVAASSSGTLSIREKIT